MPQIFLVHPISCNKNLVGMQVVCLLVISVCVTTVIAALSYNMGIVSAGERGHQLARFGALPTHEVLPLSKYTAHVLSMDKNSPRAKHTEINLNRLGFQVEFTAPHPTGITKSDKVWSNKRAFLNIIDAYLESNRTSWLYMFEDDITAHSGTTLGDIRDLETRATEFVYLGICGTSEQFWVQWWTMKNQGKCGRCAHAMGFSRKGAQDFMAFNQNKQNMYIHAMYFDMVVEAWCLSLGGFPVLHFDWTSPHISGHHGAFFQDRLQFRTSIG